MSNNEVIKFLSQYEEKVFNLAMVLRKKVLEYLPGVTEQLDISAKMIAYCYGQKYAELVCVIILSKKGLKLGFNQGPQLPDPKEMLKGEGKASRYVEIKIEEIIQSAELRDLIKAGLEAYKKRIS